MTPQDRPWLTPQVGDVCVSADGERREVVRVATDGSVVFSDAGPLLRVRVPDAWVDWCRRAVAAGGTYRRKENEG